MISQTNQIAPQDKISNNNIYDINKHTIRVLEGMQLFSTDDRQFCEDFFR